MFIPPKDAYLKGSLAMCFNVIVQGQSRGRTVIIFIDGYDIVIVIDLTNSILIQFTIITVSKAIFMNI